MPGKHAGLSRMFSQLRPVIGNWYGPLMLRRAAAGARKRSARRSAFPPPSTSARNSRGSSPCSGCHCTPTRNSPGVVDSMPSMMPSSAHATAVRPAPTMSTAWWWWVGTSKNSPPGRIDEMIVPLVTRTLWRAEAVGRAAVGVVPHQVGHVLVEGAAAGDVEHLARRGRCRAAERPAGRGLGDGQLPGVPVGRVDVRLRVLGRRRRSPGRCRPRRRSRCRQGRLRSLRPRPRRRRAGAEPDGPRCSGWT